MASALRRKETAARGVLRILRKQIDKAVEALADEQSLSDEDVHDIRKSLKRVRAALRLLRPAIGSSTYRGENVCFRDAARPLTELRDAKVLVDTLGGLKDRF